MIKIDQGASSATPNKIAALVVITIAMTVRNTMTTSQPLLNVYGVVALTLALVAITSFGFLFPGDRCNLIVKIASGRISYSGKTISLVTEAPRGARSGAVAMTRARTVYKPFSGISNY